MTARPPPSLRAQRSNPGRRPRRRTSTLVRNARLPGSLRRSAPRNDGERPHANTPHPHPSLRAQRSNPARRPRRRTPTLVRQARLPGLLRRSAPRNDEERSHANTPHPHLSLRAQRSNPGGCPRRRTSTLVRNTQPPGLLRRSAPRNDEERSHANTPHPHPSLRAQRSNPGRRPRRRTPTLVRNAQPPGWLRRSAPRNDGVRAWAAAC